MSGQNLRRDGLKSASAVQKMKKSSGDHETALKYTAQLEKENNTLRTELHELAQQNDALLRALERNKDVFENDFNKLHSEIMANEKELIENSRKCVEQQKRYQDEIKKLKQDNESILKEKTQLEQELTEKFKSLESEVKLLRLENQTLNVNDKEIQERCLKYKVKLRQAIKIVNDLNQIVAQYNSKSENLCEICTQTENVVQYHDKHTMVNWSQESGDTTTKTTKTKTNLNSENLLLSDIFFKPKSFMDSELDLFSVKSKSKSSIKKKSLVR